MPKKRKASAPLADEEAELTDEQQEHVKQLTDMDFDEQRAREAVIFTATIVEAVTCCTMDDQQFNELKEAELARRREAELIGNQREGLRAAGARTAAAQLAPVGSLVPTNLRGNAGQGAKSTSTPPEIRTHILCCALLRTRVRIPRTAVAIVNHGTGVSALPEPPPPQTHEMNASLSAMDLAEWRAPLDSMVKRSNQISASLARHA